jgi:hypothetical protein
MHIALQEYGKEAAGVTQGPLFRVEDKRKGGVEEGRKGFKRAKVGDLDNVFLPLLARVQEQHPDTIGEDVNVEEEYSSSQFSSVELRARQGINIFRLM